MNIRRRVTISQNKEDGTTAAIYFKTQKDGYSYISKRTNHFNDLYPSDRWGYGKNSFPNKIIGKVKLNEKEDKWDPEEGKKQAFIKADRIHKKCLNNYVRNWMIKVFNVLKNVDENVFEDVLEREIYLRERMGIKRR